MTTANKSEKDRVIIFDTTLRDGEQCPGATMTFEEKLEVAELLLDDRRALSAHEQPFGLEPVVREPLLLPHRHRRAPFRQM